MPSEQLAAAQHDVQQDQQQQQIKFCSLCHSTLVDTVGSVFLPDADALVCASCREHIRGGRQASYAAHNITHELQHARPYIRLSDLSPTYHPRSSSHPTHEGATRRPDLTLSTSDANNFPHSPVTAQQDAPALFSYPSTLGNAQPAVASSSTAAKPVTPALNTQCSNSVTASTLAVVSPSTKPRSSSTSSTHAQSSSSSALWKQQRYVQWDPLSDITRLRVRSQAHHCLYPGARYEGTQRSGRNSYDVNVTIVDVDFSSSFLCGYLRIRGLTDDWPELTTYFDAEIIGSRYGFLTQNWGASEHEDMVHWARFPAFKHFKGEGKRPHLTIDERDRGAVFMRWKERFLVPDHRVQDINGASFAGFYYVCVDFNSHGGSSVEDESESPPDHQTSTSQQQNKPQETGQRGRRASSARRGPRPSSVAPLPAPVATMSGFYYHQNSEPYQQLSLTHIPDRTNSSFEFR